MRYELKIETNLLLSCASRINLGQDLSGINPGQDRCLLKYIEVVNGDCLRSISGRNGNAPMKTSQIFGTRLQYV